MSYELATAYVNIVASTKGLGKEISGGADRAAEAAGKSSGGKFSSSFAGVAKKVAAVGAAVAIGLAAKGGISRALNIEDARAKLKGLGNDSQSVSKIMDNALASVSGTSFGLGEAATTAAGAVAAGIKPGADLERMLKSVANSAASAGVGMDEMGAIYNKVATTNKAQGDVLAQVNERGIPLTATLAKQLGVTADEVTKMASAGKIGFKEFESAMTEASGTVAKELGQTFRGSMANLKSAFSRIGATVMTPFLNILKDGANAAIPVLDGLNKRMKPVFDDIGKNWDLLKAGFTMSPQVAAQIGAPLEGFVKLGFGIRTVAGQIKGAVSDLRAGLTMTPAVVAQIGEPLEGFVKLGQGIRTVISGINSGVKDFFAGLTMSGGTVASIGAPLEGLVSAGAGVRAAFDGLAPVFGALGQMWGQLGPQIAALAGPVMNLVTSFSPLSMIFKALQPVLPVLVESISQLAGSALAALGAVLPPITAMLGDVSRILGEAFVALMPTVTAALGAVSGIFGQLGPVIAGVVAALAPLVTSLLSQLMPVVVQLVSSILPPVIAIFGDIASAVGPLVSAISALLIPVIQALMPVVTTVFGAVVNVVKAALQIVQGIIKVVTSAIKGDWAGVWQGVGQIFAGVWNAIKAVVTGAMQIVWSVIKAGFSIVTSTVSTALSWVANFFVNTWNSVTNGIRGFVDGFIGMFRNLPNQLMSALAGAGQWLVGVGKNIVQGLLDGAGSLLSGIGDFFLNMLPGWIVGPFKKALGIHSPSRVFREFGVNIVQGLSNGLKKQAPQAVAAIGTVAKRVTSEATKHFNNAAKLRASANSLFQKAAETSGVRAPVMGKNAAANARAMDRYRDAIASRNKKVADLIAKGRAQLAQAASETALGRRLDSTAAMINASNRQLASLTNQRVAIAAKLKTAQKSLADAIKTRDKQAADSAKSLRESFNLSDMVGRDAAGIVWGAERAAEQIKAFGSKMSQLQKAGLNASLIAQIGDLGAEKGASLADSLLAGGKGEIARLNAAFGQINTASAGAGTAIANGMYGAGIASIQGLVKGMTSQMAAIDKAARTITNRMTAQVKKNLGIYSPSRVFDREVGYQVPAGMAQGVNRGASLVDDAVSGLGKVPAMSGQRWCAARVSPAGVFTREGDDITIYAQSDPEEIARKLREKRREQQTLSGMQSIFV